jgi:adenylate cyclase
MTDVDELLASLGVPPGEVAEAEANGMLDALLFERFVLPGDRRYDLEGLAEEGGVDLATMRRIWRAMGFPDPDPDERAFTDEDVAVLRRAGDQIGEGPEIDRTLQQLRVISVSLAGIAEMVVDDFAGRRAALQSAGLGPRELAAEMVNRLDVDREQLLIHLYRRQLVAALRRRVAVGDLGDAEQPSSIGFIDLVGFTALTQELEADEFAAMVTDFETRAYETVAEHGGRVIKTLGDEVMFSTEDAATAVEIALRLTGDERRGPLTPDVRAGVTWGPVLARGGDRFGGVVNLASRLVNLALPGTVLVSDELRGVLAAEDRWDWKPLRPRRLKGLGQVRAWTVRRRRTNTAPPVGSTAKPAPAGDGRPGPSAVEAPE